MPAGRPSDYTPELADEICQRLAAPMSLSKVCKAEDMPCMASVFKWLLEHPEFTEKYTRAVEQRTIVQGEEILDISDDSEEDVQRSKLKVDTRKWLMSKMLPKKYGDKMHTELTGADGGAVRTITTIEIKAVDP